MKLKRQSKDAQIRWYQKELFDALVENKALREALEGAPGPLDPNEECHTESRNFCDPTPDCQDFREEYQGWYCKKRTDVLKGK